MPRAAALDKDLICRGPVFAEGRTLGKGLFAEGCSLRGLLWLSLGKECLCRVPEMWPSANPQALGKARVSSSEGLPFVVHLYNLGLIGSVPL